MRHVIPVNKENREDYAHHGPSPWENREDYAQQDPSLLRGRRTMRNRIPLS